jgi:hypothetical protein
MKSGISCMILVYYLQRLARFTGTEGLLKGKVLVNLREARFDSNETIAHALGVSVTSVKTAMAKLVKDDILRSTGKQGKRTREIAFGGRFLDRVLGNQNAAKQPKPNSVKHHAKQRNKDASKSPQYGLFKSPHCGPLVSKDLVSQKDLKLPKTTEDQPMDKKPNLSESMARMKAQLEENKARKAAESLIKEPTKPVPTKGLKDTISLKDDQPMTYADYINSRGEPEYAYDQKPVVTKAKEITKTSFVDIPPGPRKAALEFVKSDRAYSDTETFKKALKWVYGLWEQGMQEEAFIDAMSEIGWGENNIEGLMASEVKQAALKKFFMGKYELFKKK